jgi:hypothetical protein
MRIVTAIIVWGILPLLACFIGLVVLGPGMPGYGYILILSPWAIAALRLAAKAQAAYNKNKDLFDELARSIENAELTSYSGRLTGVTQYWKGSFAGQDARLDLSTDVKIGLDYNGNSHPFALVATRTDKKLEPIVIRSLTLYTDRKDVIQPLAARLENEIYDLFGELEGNKLLSSGSSLLYSFKDDWYKRTSPNAKKVWQSLSALCAALQSPTA